MQLAAEFEQFVFDHMIELFEHDDAIEAFGELRYSRLGEGVGSAHLHKTIARRKRTGCFYLLFDLSKSFFGVGIRYATCNDADLRAFIGARDFAPRIERRSTEICCDLGQTLVDLAVPTIRATREDDPFAGIALEAFWFARMGLISYFHES